MQILIKQKCNAKKIILGSFVSQKLRIVYYKQLQYHVNNVRIIIIIFNHYSKDVHLIVKSALLILIIKLGA